MTILLELWKHRKLVGLAVLASVVLLTIASLFSMWQVEKGLAERYKAERDAARVYAERWEGAFDVAQSANQQWAAAAETWEQQMAEMEARAERNHSRYLAERSRRLAEARRIEELEAEIDATISAPDCETALDELLGLFDWGGHE